MEKPQDWPEWLPYEEPVREAAPTAFAPECDVCGSPVPSIADTLCAQCRRLELGE